MAVVRLSGPGLVLTFEHENERVRLVGMSTEENGGLIESAEGSPGNPLTVVVSKGKYAGRYDTESFRARNMEYNQWRMSFELTHDQLPLQLFLIIETEGHVATWRGQAVWRGDESVDVDIYFPLLSKFSFGHASDARAIIPHIAGAVLSPLNEANYKNAYVGTLTSPSFLVEGVGRGIAFLDDNRADLTADPGACVRREYALGNDFGQVSRYSTHHDFWINDYFDGGGGEDGPFAGVCHSRCFSGVSKDGLSNKNEINGSEGTFSYSNHGMAVEYVDLGPIRTYAYSGNWKAGAQWVRSRRSHIPIRKSPAEWYQRTTFLAEHMGDQMVKEGQSFYDYPKLAAHKDTLGANMFHVMGFHDAEMATTFKNWINRGDYYFAAQNLGGFEAVKKGVEAIHRRGGRILYYIEGLIMWKQSRIGLSKGKRWALQEEDGSFTEHYRDFWHMDLANEEYQNWLAETCADIVRTTGIDGFFLDSSCATYNHRNYDPNHPHSHPDFWNWGLRRLLRKIREALDKVNPGTVLIIEGFSDLAAEFADGFLSHTHDWARYHFDIPYIRFLHSDMKIFESYAHTDSSPVDIRKNHLFNAVNGMHIYTHASSNELMAPYGRITRDYYDAYPEISENPMSSLDVEVENGMANLFEGVEYVLTVGNPTEKPVTATFGIPVASGVLFDRVTGERVPVVRNKAVLELEPWAYRAFEVRV